MFVNSLFSLRIHSLLILLLPYELVYGARRAGREGNLQRRFDNDFTDEADFFHFKTRPDIQAPKWAITVHDEAALATGYWLVSPYQMLSQKERGASWVGPYVYDGKGELVWSGVQLFDSFNVYDFRPIEVAGENMFTAIYKRENAGVFIDSSYQIRRMIQWPGVFREANMHEFAVFDDGSKALLLTAEFRELSREQSREFGYDGECKTRTNDLVELDISKSSPTTLFNFSISDHISLDEVTHPADPTAERMEKACRNIWDINHCNAIDRFANGDYLVSCRFTDALYKVSRQHGSILWRLGGTRSDFKLAENAKFSRQHHARVLEHNDTHTVITMFDNANSEGRTVPTYNYTRGLILSLHDDVAEVVAEYPHPNHLYTPSRGSLEILPNGNVFINWVFRSRISEHSRAGRVLMEAKLPQSINNYRSYKSPWVGRPIDPPDVWSAVVDSDGTMTEVYVSWNGATEVKRWKFYESNPQGEKTRLAKSVPKAGFETSVKLDGWVRYVMVQAIDGEDNLLGQSKVVRSTPLDRDPNNFVEEQDWLEEHVPASQVSQIPEIQGYGYSDGSIIWSVILPLWALPIILGFSIGFCIAVLAVVVFQAWLCLRTRIRRWQHGPKYSQVDKDEPEDDYELDSSLEQASDDTST